MAQTTTDEAAGRTGRGSKVAGAFDIRNFIALLIGIYGAVLIVTGLVGTSQADLQKAGGFNVNLWAGVGMAVVSIAFFVWARTRPVRLPGEGTAREDAEEPERVARP